MLASHSDKENNSHGTFRFTLTSSSVFLFLFVFIFGSCENSCRKNEGTVVGSQPDPQNNDGFISGLDNPTIVQWDDLRTYRTENGLQAFESLIKYNWGTVYQDFSLFLKANGTGTNGSVTQQQLYALPNAPLDTEYSFESDDTRFPFEIHGIQLGNGPTTFNIIHEDAFLKTRTVPVNTTIKVRLKPNTILVPIQHVIVLFGPNPQLFGLDRYTAESYEQLYDDMLPLNTFKTSEPGKPNRKIRHMYGESAKINTVRPDLVWEKCGIQFRLVKVFTLFVDDQKLIQPPSSSCLTGPFGRTFPEMQELHSLVMEIPGINSQLPVVFTVNSVEGNCTSPTGDVSGRGWATLSIKYTKSGTDPILAHELGHILGLSDIDCSKTGGSLLMCSEVLSEAITEEQCSKARTKAKEYASKMGWNF